MRDELLAAIGPLAEQSPPPPEPGEFFHFCQRVLGYADMVPETHGPPCDKLERLLGDCRFQYGTQQLFLYMDPRSTFKTSIGVEGVCLRALTKNPDIRIAIITSEDRGAVKRLGSIKKTLEFDENFTRKYGDDWRPEFRTDVWNQHQITVAKRKKILRDPTITAVGVGTNLVGSHFDLIIVDDAVTLENSFTKGARDKVYDYVMHLLPILEPGGAMIVIGTRWHTDDTYGRLVRVDEQRERDGLLPEWDKLVRSAYNPDGTLLFPTRLTHQKLDDLRRRLGARRFSANYLNQPISDLDKTFVMDYLQLRRFSFIQDASTGVGLVRDHEGAQHPVDVTIVWDPAGKQASRRSDEHGVTVVGTDPNDVWWLLEAEGLKGTPTAIIHRVCNLIAFYRPRLFAMEDIGTQGLWWNLLEQELSKRGLRVSYKPLSHEGLPKTARIEALQPKWERLEIILSAEHHDLIRQFDDFTPTSDMEHDDIIDSLAYHLKITRRAPQVGRTHFNPIDEEWVERERKRRGGEPASRAGGLGSRWG